ncbi:MAG: Crossover junction endodeoxyribonuclease RuvC [Acidobacteriota bacterium]|nr:Crossover junction endodeoxyribonuclease RuvC [Acidobacteriota bacterium]
MNGPRILAVDPGRTMFGVAVFEGASLRYYGVKCLRVPGTPAEVRRAAARVISKLIATYRPTHMAIEQPLVVQQRAELLAHVIAAIKATARVRGLPVCEYAPLPVRRLVCLSEKPTKCDVSRRLAERYPELARYDALRGAAAKAYYERMFGAVAVGLVANELGGARHEKFGGGLEEDKYREGI